MLLELEPAATKNGLVGQYRTASGDKHFAVLVMDNTPPDKHDECIHKINEQIAKLEQATPSASDVTTTSGAANKVFSQPELIMLEPDTEIEDVIQDRLAADINIIFICPDKPTYAQTCSQIGITRADHLVSAELHALVNTHAPEEEAPVAGGAKELQGFLRTILNKHRPEVEKIRKRLKQVKRGHVHSSEDLVEKSRNAISEYHSREKMLTAIPRATKFHLGNYVLGNSSSNTGLPILGYTNDMAELITQPWLFRLPFETCLLEYDVHAIEGIKKAQSNDTEPDLKCFLLASRVPEEPSAFIGHVIGIRGSSAPNPGVSVENYSLIWDISGKTLEAGISYHSGLMPTNIDKIRQDSEGAGVWLSCFLPAISQLNDMRTRVNSPTPSSNQRKSRGSKDGKNSRYYAYHSFTPAPNTQTEASEPNENLENDPRRLHKRRGHYRTYRSERYREMRGRTVWMQEQIWGDESTGILGKEYDLSESISPPTPS